MRGCEKSVMGKLVGKRVSELYVSDAEGSLQFISDTGAYVFEVDGDCCSQSWFADITGVDALLGHVVTGVESVTMGDVNDGRSRQEVDELYKVTITTDAGRCDILWRNSSNGFYGGSMIEATGTSRVRLLKFKKITDDWSA